MSCLAVLYGKVELWTDLRWVTIYNAIDSIDFWAKNSLFNMSKMVHWLWIFDILGDRVVKGDEILSDTDHYSRHLHSSHQLAKVPKSGSNWSGGLSKTRNLPLFCPHWYWSHKLLSLDWIVSTLWDLKKYLHHNYDEDGLDDDYYYIYVVANVQIQLMYTLAS